MRIQVVKIFEEDGSLLHTFEDIADTFAAEESLDEEYEHRVWMKRKTVVYYIVH